MLVVFCRGTCPTAGTVARADAKSVMNDGAPRIRRWDRLRVIAGTRSTVALVRNSTHRGSPEGRARWPSRTVTHTNVLIPDGSGVQVTSSVLLVSSVRGVSRSQGKSKRGNRARLDRAGVSSAFRLCDVATLGALRSGRELETARAVGGAEPRRSAIRTGPHHRASHRVGDPSSCYA